MIFHFGINDSMTISVLHITCEGKVDGQIFKAVLRTGKLKVALWED